MTRTTTPPASAAILAVAMTIVLSSLGLSQPAWPSSPPGDSDDAQPESNPGTVKVEKPDPAQGLALAQTLCTSCHIIGDQPAAGPHQADVPSFARIANDPNRSIDTLKQWLMAPHAPMPDLQLTRKEMGDLAAYIMSLKKAE